MLVALCATFIVGCSKISKREDFEGSVDSVVYRVARFTYEDGRVNIGISRKCGENWLHAGHDKDYNKKNGFEQITLFSENGITTVLTKNRKGTWLIDSNGARIYDKGLAKKYANSVEADLIRVVDLLTRQE